MLNTQYLHHSQHPDLNIKNALFAALFHLELYSIMKFFKNMFKQRDYRDQCLLTTGSLNEF